MPRSRNAQGRAGGLRGCVRHGRWAPRAGIYTSQESVEDLDALRQALGGTPLSLFAVSYGDARRGHVRARASAGRRAHGARLARADDRTESARACRACTRCGACSTKASAAPAPAARSRATPTRISRVWSRSFIAIRCARGSTGLMDVCIRRASLKKGSCSLLYGLDLERRGRACSYRRRSPRPPTATRHRSRASSTPCNPRHPVLPLPRIAASTAAPAVTPMSLGGGDVCCGTGADDRL